MSISPLHAQVPRLCSRLLEDPQEVLNTHRFQGTLYTVAAVIIGLAAVAIFAGSAAIWLGMITASKWIPIAGAFVSILASKLATRLWELRNTEFTQTDEYKLIVDMLNTPHAEGGVKDWTSAEIMNFFEETDMNTPLSQKDLNALEQKSPGEPLLGLLPLIARFNILTKKENELTNQIRGNYDKVAINHDEGKYDLELLHLHNAMRLEEICSFTKLEQAVVLQNILFPTMEYAFKNTDQGLALMAKGQEQPIGIIKQKNLEMRSLDYITNRALEFFVSEGRDLTVDDFDENSPNENRARIFDPL